MTCPTDDKARDYSFWTSRLKYISRANFKLSEDYLSEDHQTHLRISFYARTLCARTKLSFYSRTLRARTKNSLRATFHLFTSLSLSSFKRYNGSRDLFLSRSLFRTIPGAHRLLPPFNSRFMRGEAEIYFLETEVRDHRIRKKGIKGACLAIAHQNHFPTHSDHFYLSTSEPIPRVNLPHSFQQSEVKIIFSPPVFVKTIFQRVKL